MIDEHTLCLRYCGLTNEDAICFNHQIKKCNGICTEQEEIELYNKRANEILKNYIFTDSNFVLIDKGRTPEEKAIILIENGHYAGYAYFDGTQQISGSEEFKNLVKRATYYPDADDIVRVWLKQNVNSRKVLL